MSLPERYPRLLNKIYDSSIIQDNLQNFNNLNQNVQASIINLLQQIFNDSKAHIKDFMGKGHLGVLLKQICQTDPIQYIATPSLQLLTSIVEIEEAIGMCISEFNILNFIMESYFLKNDQYLSLKDIENFSKKLFQLYGHGYSIRGSI